MKNEIIAIFNFGGIFTTLIPILYLIFMLSLGVLIFIVLVKKAFPRNHQKQMKEAEKMKLTIVRSQLNPHFMFNALAGIQNLMNKNDIDNANRYLGKFARITRNVLEAKEQISIAEEMRLLD